MNPNITSAPLNPFVAVAHGRGGRAVEGSENYGRVQVPRPFHINRMREGEASPSRMRLNREESGNQTKLGTDTIDSVQYSVRSCYNWRNN